MVESLTSCCKINPDTAWTVVWLSAKSTNSSLLDSSVIISWKEASRVDPDTAILRWGSLFDFDGREAKLGSTVEAAAASSGYIE